MLDPLVSSLSSSQAGAPIPGPLDRTSFFDEQQRNRRATWRLALACALAILIVGVPLSLVLSPLLYGLALIVLNTIHLIVPIPAAMRILQGAGNLAFSLLDYLSGESASKLSSLGLAFGIAAWLVPGVLAAVVIWSGIYFLFRQTGVGSILLTLGARAPKSADLEEQQLQNLVEEMALAAGVPPARVMLLDAPFNSAAAIGSCPEDAIVIVSRHLLDAYDRDQTQAVIGHLIGSIGNGDLRIAFLMTSVLLTCGALTAIVKAPFAPHGRTSLFRLVRLGFNAWRRKLGGEAEQELFDILITHGLKIETTEEKRTPLWLAPLMFANLAVQWTLYVLVPGLLTPLLALLWRARRYLADATAVQLTRDPDALARALLASHWGVIPGTQSVAHLFISGPVGAESFADFFNWQGVGFHPPLQQRLRRLTAIGAHLEMTNRQPSSPWSSLSKQHPVLVYALRALLTIVLLVAAAACLAAIVLLVLTSLFFTTIFLGVIYGVFALLGSVKGWLVG